jgi:hypothetical protein
LRGSPPVRAAARAPGLAWWPVLPAFAACAVGAATVGALAMLASLYLPRVATILLVMMGVGLVAAVNVAGLSREPVGRPPRSSASARRW